MVLLTRRLCCQKESGYAPAMLEESLVWQGEQSEHTKSDPEAGVNDGNDDEEIAM